MSLIIQISDGVKCLQYMAKNLANVLLPSSEINICTICVFINKNHVQGGGGGTNRMAHPFKKSR